MEAPFFFVDRSLGRRRLPEGLRRQGWNLQTLAEVYGIPADESIEDVEWLRLAGTQGWPVLMKDDRIRYREVERRALLDSGVQAFCLANGNLTAAEMIARFVRHRDAIWRACGLSGPYLFSISVETMRRVPI